MAYRFGSALICRNRSRFGLRLGAVIGIFLLPAATGLLWWNESHAIDAERALAEGAGVVRDAPADRIDPALDGKLVHVSGPLSVPGSLADPDFPTVRAPVGAVQFRRIVQTYQWQETTSRGSHSYRQVWSEQPISSAGFRQPGGPQNPPPRYRAQQLTAQEARLGPYRLTERLLRTLGGSQPVMVPNDAALARPGSRLYGNGIYIGQNPDAPQIGDQRLTWEAVWLSETSVVARQQGDGFAPYEAKSGASIHLISRSLLTAKEMIGDAEQANVFGTWVGRLVGAGLMFLSFFLVLRLLLLGLPLSEDGPGGGGTEPTLLRQAASVGPAPAAAVATLAAAPAIVAVAWWALRPAAGICVLGLGLVAAWLLTQRRQGR